MCKIFTALHISIPWQNPCAPSPPFEQFPTTLEESRVGGMKANLLILKNTSRLPQGSKRGGGGTSSSGVQEGGSQFRTSSKMHVSHIFLPQPSRSKHFSKFGGFHPMFGSYHHPRQEQMAIAMVSWLLDVSTFSFLLTQ